MKKIIIVPFIVTIVLFCSFRVKQTADIKASIERGQKIYVSTCLACHQIDGAGVQRMNPPLIKTKWVLGNKRALAKILLNGLKGGEIDIDGDSFHNPMPPQATLMTDQQIADVLTYVRNSFGNKASPVTTADIAAARGKTNASGIKKPSKTVPAPKTSPKKQ